MKQTLRNFLPFVFTSLLLVTILPAVAASESEGNKHPVWGTVKDTNGVPLVGVSVVVVGTHSGVNTDIKGTFRIIVADGATLRFSYIGYEPQELKIKPDRVGYDITLKEQSTDIGQVVVTGFAKTEIRKSTGSVAVIEGKDLKTSPLEGVDKLLQGKLAGVSVQSVSGRPGEAVKIRIRGASTITGNAEPLWVIDGVPMQKEVPTPPVSNTQIRSGDFSNIFATGIGGINPNDIESISVLKDAAAAAIYGSQAAGGVIVVTTKRGKSGPTHVNYSGTVSIQTRPVRSANLMNSREKLAWEQELWDEFAAAGYANNLQDGKSYYPVVGIVGMIRSGYGKYKGLSVAEQDARIAELGSHTTDWFEELFRTTVSTSHYLSISGGNPKMAYYLSMGYGNDQGIVLKNSYDRYNFNGKIDVTPNRVVSFGISTDFSYQTSKAPSSNVDMFKYAYFANPYERPYNDDGSYRADETYFSLSEINGSYTVALPENGFNLMREINETSAKSTSGNFTLTGNTTVNITKDLKFVGLASFSYISDHGENINGKNTYAAWMDRPFENNTTTSKRIYGSIYQTSTYNTNYMLRGHFAYGHTFNEIHRLNVLAGAQISRNYAKTIFTKRYGYDPVTGNHSTPLYPASGNNSVIDYDKLVSFGKTLDNSTGQAITENAMASFYGTIDYILLNRYVFNASVRSDGSNNFGSKEQFNATWSAGFSWNIDEESWMKGKISDVISSMTLRLATGYTGGVNKSVYPVIIMKYDNTFRISDTDSYRMGTISNAPNPHLSWEKTWDIKAGLDIGFFKDRLRLQVEAYNRKGYDLVTSSRVNSAVGFISQGYNTSEQVNRGVEFTLGATILRYKDFAWNFTANAAYNMNKLTKYVSPNSGIYGQYYVGYPQGMIITGKSTGIDPSTGFYNYELRPDAKINEVADYRNMQNYLFYVGTSTAPWTGGFNTSVRYKGLTLSMNGVFSLNGKVLNDIVSPASYSSVSDRNMTGVDKEPIPNSKYDLYVNHLNVVRDVTYRWTPDNPVTDGYPRLIDIYGGRLYDQNGNLIAQSLPSESRVTNCLLLENVSYLKISSLTLLYDLPGAWVKKLHMQNCSVSFTMNNLATFTNYSGLDPETPGAVYPQCRSYSIGLSIGF